METVRPKSVTVLALLVLTLTVMKFLRLVYSIREWSFIVELLPSLSIYLLLSGLIWVIIGVPAFISLWFGLVWGPLYIRVISLIFTINYWTEYILLVDADGRQDNWLLLASLNVVLLFWVFWLFSRTKLKQYFGAEYE